MIQSLIVRESDGSLSYFSAPRNGAEIKIAAEAAKECGLQPAFLGGRVPPVAEYSDSSSGTLQFHWMTGEPYYA